MEKYIWFILACFLTVGCSDENELKPSSADRDWFVIEDSEDHIGHERFLLYEKYGIPVFVNDTIGVEERGVDYYGNPVMYYCTLDINYTVGAPIVSFTKTGIPYFKNDTIFIGKPGRSVGRNFFFR